MMASLSSRLAAVVVLFTTVILVHPPTVHSREVTNEDIRDAMLSLVHMVRATEDKLERHEMRERQLGELLKKALAGLDKRHRTLEPVKGTLGRLDERLAGVETILLQQDERDRVQFQKTTDAIQNIQSSLQAWMTSTTDMLKTQIHPNVIPDKSTQSTAPSIDVSSITSGLTNQIQNIKSSLDSIASKLDNGHVNSVLNEKSSDLLKKVESKIKNNEELLERYETKLAEMNNRVVPTEILPITVKDQNDWHANFLTALNTQKSFLEQISSDIKTSNVKIDKLPTKQDAISVSNYTLESLQELKYEMKINNNQSIIKLDSKIVSLQNTIKENQDEVVKGISDLTIMSENVITDVMKSYELLRGEIQGLNKVEKVMIQTADNVLDTKRRIEYGVRQILLEVGDLVKVQGKGINATVNNRFDGIESTILDNQTGALANLTHKIETEMSQVWRQIGIMYQQLTANNNALDRLQQQTETYVNGSLSTMDSMEGKVGQITGRMSEVDENLNYLLGRLSLVTQEFNQIKTGLGSALDNIRSSFLTVQKKIKDAGPGPHEITDMDHSDKEKTSYTVV